MPSLNLVVRFCAHPLAPFATRKLLTAFVGEPDRFAAGASYNQGKYIRILRGGHNTASRQVHLTIKASIYAYLGEATTTPLVSYRDSLTLNLARKRTY